MFWAGSGWTSQGSAGRAAKQGRVKQQGKARSKAVQQDESRDPSKAMENRVCQQRRIEKRGRRECKAVQKGKAEQWAGRPYENFGQGDG